MAHPFSIWSQYDLDLSPEETVLAIERRGMTVCELSDEDGAALLEREGDPKEIGRAFGAFAAAHGVSYPQGHLWLKVHICDPDQDIIGQMTRWFELFGAIGVKNAVLHCDSASFPEGTDKETMIAANVEMLKKLIPIAAKNGLRVCLENLIAFQCADLLEMIRRADQGDALGICLDTGHLNLTKDVSQGEFIRRAGSLLHALHIADNQGETDQHMMPFGRGEVDFADVMQALKEVGYSDLFNYEIPGESHIPIELRDAKAVYLQTVTDYLFSL